MSESKNEFFEIGKEVCARIGEKYGLNFKKLSPTIYPDTFLYYLLTITVLSTQYYHLNISLGSLFFRGQFGERLGSELGDKVSVSISNVWVASGDSFWEGGKGKGQKGVGS